MVTKVTNTNVWRLDINSRLAGTQPNPSIEFSRSTDKQMSPSTEMLGCHSFVRHLTLGGCKQWRWESALVLAFHEDPLSSSHRHIVLLGNVHGELEFSVLPVSLVGLNGEEELVQYIRVWEENGAALGQVLFHLLNFTDQQLVSDKCSAIRVIVFLQFPRKVYHHVLVAMDGWQDYKCKRDWNLEGKVQSMKFLTNTELWKANNTI